MNDWVPSPWYQGILIDKLHAENSIGMAFVVPVSSSKFGGDGFGFWVGVDGYLHRRFGYRNLCQLSQNVLRFSKSRSTKLNFPFRRRWRVFSWRAHANTQIVPRNFPLPAPLILILKMVAISNRWLEFLKGRRFPSPSFLTYTYSYFPSGSRDTCAPRCSRSPKTGSDDHIYW